jgi:hypothetical protein
MTEKALVQKPSKSEPINPLKTLILSICLALITEATLAWFGLVNGASRIPTGRGLRKLDPPEARR